MRISFFVPRCTPENSHGRYVVELAIRLCGDHRVTIYSGSFWSSRPPEIRCRQLLVPNRPALARMAALWATSTLAAGRRDSDIRHTQGADAPVGNVVTAQFCSAKFDASAVRSGALRRVNRVVGTAAEKYCMSKRSTLWVIAISRQVKADVEQEYGVDPAKVVVIHHGVDTEVFHPRNNRNHDAARQRLGLGPDEFVIIFVGGDYRRKGLVPLLQAAMRVGEKVKVLAVGVDPDGTLTRTVDGGGFADLVTFLSATADIAPLYAVADCFVLPTTYDTFSMATLEAMACGLPVLVSRAAGVSEILSHNHDSLVVDSGADVETLAEHIGRLARDRGLRYRLGHEARRTAERHSWDWVAKQTLDVYKETSPSRS